MAKKLNVEVISQEKHLLTKQVDEVIAPAVLGEVTILPDHIPLFTKLNDGIVVLVDEDSRQEYAILGGFMDVGPNNKLTILADAAFNTDDVNEAKALEAKKAAEKALQQKESEVDFRQAEASLRKAILELKIARRKHQRVPGQTES